MKKFFYRVQKGDLLCSIANKFNACLFKLIKENCLKEEVRGGQLLFIEMEESELYEILPSDTIYSLCKKFNKSKDEILIENQIEYIFCGLKIKV